MNSFIFSFYNLNIDLSIDISICFELNRLGWYHLIININAHVFLITHLKRVYWYTKIVVILNFRYVYLVNSKDTSLVRCHKSVKVELGFLLRYCEALVTLFGCFNEHLQRIMVLLHGNISIRLSRDNITIYTELSQLVSISTNETSYCKDCRISRVLPSKIQSSTT